MEAVERDIAARKAAAKAASAACTATTETVETGASNAPNPTVKATDKRQATVTKKNAKSKKPQRKKKRRTASPEELAAMARAVAQALPHTDMDGEDTELLSASSDESTLRYTPPLGGTPQASPEKRPVGNFHLEEASLSLSLESLANTEGGFDLLDRVEATATKSHSRQMREAASVSADAPRRPRACRSASLSNIRNAANPPSLSSLLPGDSTTPASAKGKRRLTYDKQPRKSAAASVKGGTLTRRLVKSTKKKTGKHRSTTSTAKGSTPSNRS